jgi:hypothetical protein
VQLENRKGTYMVRFEQEIEGGAAWLVAEFGVRKEEGGPPEGAERRELRRMLPVMVENNEYEVVEEERFGELKCVRCGAGIGLYRVLKKYDDEGCVRTYWEAR